MARPDSCIVSGVHTASGAAALIITTTAGMLCSVNTLIATTGDATVIGYDNALTGSGTKIYHRVYDSSIVGNGGFDSLPIPIVFTQGLTFTVTGTAPDGVLIGYRDRL